MNLYGYKENGRDGEIGIKRFGSCFFRYYSNSILYICKES